MITDNDLRDLFAQRANDVPVTHEIPSSLLRRVRRRQGVAAVTAAVAVCGLVIGAWLSAAVLSPSEALNRERDNGTVGLLPPTPDTLAGIWARVQGPDLQPTQFVARFSNDGRFVFDNSGEFDSHPAIVGTYAVQGDTISFGTTHTETCPVADKWAFRATLSQDGRLDIVFIEDGTGRCRVGVGTEWTLVRVSPRSAAGALILADEPTGEAVPPAALDLTGVWFREDGQLLSLRGDMSYQMDDEGDLDTRPDEKGEYGIRGRTLTLTTGVGSKSCPKGAVKVWKNLRLDGWTLRGVVAEDECTDAVGDEQQWIVISGGTYPRDND